MPTVALVAQQAEYVRAETEARVLGLSGGTSIDSWDAGRWQETLNGTDVLVCTPQVRPLKKSAQFDLAQLLLNLLTRHWKLEDVSLLVFDEAHHATGDHPYAQIMHSHYHQLPPTSRPRILGLTASPVITSRQAAAMIAKLESVLAARIVSADLDGLRSDRPDERTIVYAASSFGVQETPFEALLAATPVADRFVTGQLVQQIATVKSVR